MAGIVLLAVFLALALPGLDRPGLHMDEGANGITASFVLGSPERLANRILMVDYIQFFGRVFPVQSEYYVGAVIHYFVKPFLWVFGPSPAALRLPCILLAGAALLFLHGTMRRCFGPRAAFLATLLAAVNFQYVQYSRVAFHREEMLMIPFLGAAFYCMTRYLESRQSSWLRFVGLCLGLGFSAKFTFGWYLVALLLAGAFTLGFEGIRAHRRRIAEGLIFLALGSAPWLLYNVRNGLPTAVLIINSLSAPTAVEGVPKGGVENLRYGQNFKVRYKQLWELFSGQIEVSADWGINASLWIERMLDLAGGCEAAAILAFGFLAFRTGSSLASKTVARFLWIFYAVVFLQSPFTVSGLDPGHLVMLLPFPQVAMGLTLDYLWDKRRCRAAARTGMAFLVSSHLYANAHYYQGMKSGGRGRWSSAVYEVARFLASSEIRSPLMFGWALRENIAFLTEDQVKPELCVDDSPEKIARLYRDLLSRGPVYILWAATEHESSQRQRYFLQLAAKEGKRPRLVRTFSNAAGDPVVWLYRLESGVLGGVSPRTRRVSSSNSFSS